MRIELSRSFYFADMGTIAAGSIIETARIPELPVNDLDLSIGDKLPIYIASADRTRQISLATLRAFLLNGSTTTITPQPVGNSFVVTAGAGEANTKIFNIPSIAGQLFILRRNFVGTLDIGVDYECLSSGGFKLLGATDIISLGEKFEIQLAIPTISVSSGGTGGKIFDGEVSISVNTTLNQASHLKKLIRLRPTAAGMIVKVPKVDEFPDNEVLFLEAVINAPHETQVQTQAGQNFYFNGESVQELILRSGESIMIQRAASGWYVLVASPSMYEVGELTFGYKKRSNEILCVGQELNRASYKRLWNWIQNLSDSLVDEATWNTASATVAGRVVEFPFRGCFSEGDGSTTFRLPDWSNMTPRVLNNAGGTDDQRHLNKPGGYQADEVKEHTHSSNTIGGANANWNSGSPDGKLIDPAAKSGNITITLGSYGGAETRMKNIGVIAKICI